MLALRRGDLREAIADARTALEAGRQGGFYTTMLVLSTLVRALVEHGDPLAAQRELEHSGMAADVPDSFLHNFVLDSRGWLRLAEGRIDEAIADFEEVRRRHGRRHQRNPGLSTHRSGLALARLRAGDHDGAIAVAEEELALAEEWAAASLVGVSRRTLGLATGGEPGLALLRASVAVLAGSGARLEHARSLVELGAALRRAGTRGAAREPLHAGMELAFACAADPLVERAREELVACGARPRRIMRSGVDALTPSELRVARMAAEGLSNREIAQALFVTLRTVQVHLAHTFQKLDIGSRADLPAALAGQAASASASSPREEMSSF
jgi:ATP/maltotriose-dependent transcriptional regulator MalT